MKALRIITTLAIILAFLVVTLGAYTRLTNAGLGCPDWPGCYGHMVLPSVAQKLQQAQANYPAMPIESRKAWTEMVHRYAAGTLGLLILIIAIGALTLRAKGNRLSIVIPNLLVALLVFQALLGMWTVTLKLLPVVVMGHLLGGMLIFASLCYFRWQISDFHSLRPTACLGDPDDLPQNSGSPGRAGGRRDRVVIKGGLQATKLSCWVMLGVIIVLTQIALGGWVSSNYAGIACVGFPQCNGQWLPTLHFSEGFNLFSPVGANYQGGVLDSNIRVTIQFMHRLGAVITALYVLLLSFMLCLRFNTSIVRRMACLAIVIVLIQFTLGIVNVVYFLPLWIAVAHNGVAALLLAVMVSLLYLARGVRIHAR